MRKHFCALGGASPHSGTLGKSAPRFGFTRQLGDAFHFTVTSAGVYTCRSRSGRSFAVISSKVFRNWQPDMSLGDLEMRC